jgi:hypothetical protein
MSIHSIIEENHTQTQYQNKMSIHSIIAKEKTTTEGELQHSEPHIDTILFLESILTLNQKIEEIKKTQKDNTQLKTKIVILMNQIQKALKTLEFISEEKQKDLLLELKKITAEEETLKSFLDTSDIQKNFKQINNLFIIQYYEIINEIINEIIIYLNYKN